MADKWYYANDQEKLGPFSSAQLKELATLGQLVPTHTVWKEGIEKGVLAAKVKNLFSAGQGESPPPAVAEVPSSGAPAQANGSVPALAHESSPLSPHTMAENQGPALQADKDEEPKLQSPKAPKQNQPSAKRLFRVVGSSGAVVIGQDGTYVRYKKKCPRCGYEDSSLKTMAIRSGVNRDRFFCQKCRKLQQVEIHGAV
jgi:GYF domain 2